MNYDLIKNLGILTLIKHSILKKMVEISENCICDSVLDAVQSEEDIISINIGIGTLFINIVDYEISYKFEPSQRLEKKLIKSIDTGESPLVQNAETKLNKKIVNTYKELL